MNIYLDIDGTLIHEDLTDNYCKPAAGLEEFIIALRPHNVYWLTTHCRDGNPERAREILKEHLPESLHADIDRIKPTIWDTMKTQGIDWSKDFIWVDNDIMIAERKLFESAKPEQQIIEVNLILNPKQLLEIARDIII